MTLDITSKQSVYNQYFRKNVVIITI